MRLIEKKCPNCGGGLSFTEKDKSCKCDYCRREFEIERKETADGSSVSYDLTPYKVFSLLTLIPIFIGILVFGFAIFIGYSAYRSTSENSDFGGFSDIIEDDNKLLSDVGELSNSDLDRINNDASIRISYGAKGASSPGKSFYREDVERQKIYLAYKDEENLVIAIYKAEYYNFFNQSDRYIIYVPLVYRNVTKDTISTLEDEKVEAPEFYFDSEHTTYFYGYASLDEAIKAKIEPLKEDYKVTEK